MPSGADRQPCREAGELLLFPPWLAGGPAESFQALVYFGDGKAQRFRSGFLKRLLVRFQDFDAAGAEGGAERVAYRQPFGHGGMFRREKTVFQQIGDPAGAIDKQSRDNGLAAALPQCADYAVQAGRGQPILALAPLGDGGHGFG